MEAAAPAQKAVQSPAQEPDLLCGQCGYNLRGVTSDRCPECGQPFDLSHLSSDLIPWEQRKYIGRWHAFWRTVFLASFKPSQLAAKMASPVSRSSAARFHAMVLLLAGAAVFTLRWTATNISPNLFVNTRRSESLNQLYAFLLNPESFLLSSAAIALWLIPATALIGCFAHPRMLPPERQHRALAISHYACAPLVFFALILLAAWGGTWLLVPQGYGEDPEVITMILAQLLGAGIGITTLIWLLRRHNLRQRAQAHPGEAPRAAQPLHPATAVISLFIGALSVTLAWTKPHQYQDWFGIHAANRLRDLGILFLLLPFIWSVINSIRIVKLCCAYTRGQTARIAIALLLAWIVTLAICLATVHAIYLVVMMYLLR